MSGETINARDIAKNSRALFARLGDDFVNDKEGAEDRKVIGDDVSKALLFTQAIAYTPIPEAFPGAPAEYLADRQEVVLERERQVAVVFEAGERYRDAVDREKERARKFIASLGGGLLSFGANAVMGIVKGGL